MHNLIKSVGALIVIITSLNPHLSRAAERVVQFAGVVSSITERRETTEFLDKVLCNLVIVNTSQTSSTQKIVGVNFYNYGYSGVNLNSARVYAPATAPGTDEQIRYNQILIHPLGGADTDPSCIDKNLEPLGTCVMQFITNTIPAGSSTIGVCAGNVRVQDSDPAIPGFVVASGSASLIQEVKVLGGVLSGAHFLSGPAFTRAATTDPISAAGSAAGIIGATPVTQLPSNMNIECKNSCSGVATGVLQSLSRTQNPGTDFNQTAAHGDGSVFSTVRNFCRGNGSLNSPIAHSSGKQVYDALWTSTVPASINNSSVGPINSGINISSGQPVFGNSTAANLAACNTFSTTKYASTLKECHYRYFQDRCIEIANEIEKQFYQGNIGYFEDNILTAFYWELSNLNSAMVGDQVFRNKCLLPLGLFNITSAGAPDPMNTLTTAVGSKAVVSYPGSTLPADVPSAACMTLLNSDNADRAMGAVGSYIVQSVAADALRGYTNPFRYSRLPANGPAGQISFPPTGGASSLLCDAICGGSFGYDGASGIIHEPNLGMEAGVLDNAPGSQERDPTKSKITFGALAQKIAPPEFKGGLVKEILIGGYGTICSANEAFLDYNNIKDPGAFNSRSINGQYRYCENRPQGGSDDLLFGVQGLVGYPVNGGSPF
ncbi:MAG: hypothetical protein KA715_14090 [Xanthomonadaceae bacterium]|nr:hypothetical protein [Xanthomonadaceae bacterium]